MFRLYDDFKVKDDNQQPYSLEVERHTAVENLHAKVENEEFCLNSIGNRFVFKTPVLSDFHMEMHFGFTCMYEFDPNFTVLFHYDKKRRQGEGIRVTYDLNGKFVVSYLSLDKMKVTVIDTVSIDEVQLTEESRYEFSIDVKENALSGTIDGRPFDFTVRKGSGHLAIERKNYIGQWIISDVTITSEAPMLETVIQSERTVDIPLLNGGDIPYRLTWCIKRINEQLYIDYSLSDGTSSREENRMDRPGQYAAEKDFITSPYIKVSNGCLEEKFYLFNGMIVLSDPNIFWECLKLYWKTPDMPAMRRNAIPENLIGENTTITYGYENFSASGYIVQAGGPSEFIYDLEGRLLYGGDALTECIYELRSPADKKAVSLIPQDCYNKWEVVSHLENNHYFMAGEEIRLTFLMRTKLNAEYIRIRAEIRDIYDTTVLASYVPDLKVQDWMFGYQEISCEISHAPMEEKLYRIVFLVQYGDREIDSYDRVFEVFDVDSEVSPAVASGLPYVFSMPNEQKWLSRNSFDLWNPLPSCDVEHYISAVTDTPIEAERKRVWEGIKPFKRQWYAWLGHRTCRGWQMENHMDVVKNADYLCYPAPIETYGLRNDFHRLSTYTTNPGLRNILRDFLAENPQFADKLSFAIPDEPQVDANAAETEEFTDYAGGSWMDFTPENIKELMDLCHAEWTDYAVKKIHAAILEQNALMKSINPKYKRSAYGPFGPYVNPTLSYHTIRSFGLIPEECLAEDVYTGFAVFEDYPYSCSYQTYRGAFGAMTILLHVPGLTLYPEQYKGSKVNGSGSGVVEEIRRLYAEGVSLVAVSDITGLEDIFGVAPRRRKVMIDTLECGDGAEYIYPIETECYYESVDAEVLLAANGEPVIFRKGNAVLLNAPVSDLGFECYEGSVAKGRKNVSPMFKQQVMTMLRDLAKPCVLGENVGTTLFETEKGETVLMAIDYAGFDNRQHEKRTAVVALNLEGVTDVVSDRDILQVRDKNGELRELRFDILPHETVFVRLAK